MIDSDKIKVGQRVWFKNGDKIESGCITGWGQQAFCPGWYEAFGTGMTTAEWEAKYGYNSNIKESK